MRQNTPLSDPLIEKRQIELLSVLMFLFMLLLAIFPGLEAVRGLQWGASVDFHRDASFVRATVEGHYGEDPTYLGGSLWYTPLVGWLSACGVWLTGLPVDLVIVQLGAYTNLLTPIAFFIMCWYFFGAPRAVICTAIFLFFIINEEPGWAVPTYSPRLIPVSFCHWFLYIELILIDRAFRSTRTGPSLVAGVGAGITFLAHAAPALISVLIIFLFTMRGSLVHLRAGNKAEAWKRFRASIFAGAAFIVCSLPMTWIIVGEYGMKVVNRSYFLYNYYALTLREGEKIIYYNFVWINLIAAIGVWLLIKRRIVDTTGRIVLARQLVLTWLMLATALMVYSYIVAVLDSKFNILLPGILPPFHFYFYMKGALIVCAGLAVWQGFQWIARRVRPALANLELSANRSSVVVLFALVALACTLNYPSYATRRDVFAVRNRNLAFGERTNHGEACVRINAMLPWDAVILCDVELSIWPLLPSARKVVATTRTMGNPYLDQAYRDDDRDELLLGMKEPRTTTQVLMDKYTVTHLLLRPTDLDSMPEVGRWFTKEVFRDDEYVLLAR